MSVLESWAAFPFQLDGFSDKEEFKPNEGDKVSLLTAARKRVEALGRRTSEGAGKSSFDPMKPNGGGNECA